MDDPVSELFFGAVVFWVTLVVPDVRTIAFMVVLIVLGQTVTPWLSARWHRV